jgi:flagellar biosynthesis protein
VNHTGGRANCFNAGARGRTLLPFASARIVREAVSLRYDPGPGKAPRVTAKGHGSWADEIIRIAREYNVPIREDKNLIQILSRLDLDEQIPPELYRVIAEILAFIYRIGTRYLEIAGFLHSRDNAEPRV